MNLVNVMMKTEVSFMSLSCIVQTLWNMCQYQVKINATVLLFIKMDEN